MNLKCQQKCFSVSHSVSKRITNEQLFSIKICCTSFSSSTAALIDHNAVQPQDMSGCVIELGYLYFYLLMILSFNENKLKPIFEVVKSSS